MRFCLAQPTQSVEVSSLFQGYPGNGSLGSSFRLVSLSSAATSNEYHYEKGYERVWRTQGENARLGKKLSLSMKVRGKQLRRDALRRYFVFRMKLIELFHFHLLWGALTEEQFTPENVMGHSGRDFAASVRTALLGWYCTIVDKTTGGLNVFKVWLEVFTHRKEIERVRKSVEPHWEVIKTFRDKCAFHADTPRNYFLAKQAIRDSRDVAKSVQEFLDLAKFLILREEDELPDFVPEVETFLLDFS